MSSYVTLVGAEDVSRAASNMQSAASTMSSAAENIDYSLMQHQRFMDDWLQRLEAIMKPEAS